MTVAYTVAHPLPESSARLVSVVRGQTDTPIFLAVPKQEFSPMPFASELPLLRTAQEA